MKFTKALLLTFGLFVSICNAQDVKEIEKQKSKLKLFEVEKLEGNYANLHNKYAGKVVFSNSEIEKSDTDSKLITSYTFGDKLYIKGFFSQSMMNSMFLQMTENGVKAKDINAGTDSRIWDSGYKLYLYLDGKGIAINDDSKSEIKTSLSLKATLYSGDNNSENFGERLFTTLKSKSNLLTPGVHKLKLVYIPYTTNSIANNLDFKPIAVGEIDMVIKDLKFDKNDPVFCMPAAKMNEKALEAKIITFVKSKGYNIVPKVVRITSDKWTIKRNNYGKITKRYIETYVGYTQDGKCKYMYLDINQDYDGAGYQDDIYFTTGIDFTKDKVISCECLK